MTSLTAQIATALRTTEGRLYARLVGLKIAPVCGRCGGCGRYSFNGSHSRCYGCNGSGHKAPTARQLPGILAEAEACAADGRLDAYLEFLAANRRIRNAVDKVMAEWKATGISDMYDWREAADGVQPHRRIADVNAKMAAAYERVMHASFALAPSSPTYQQDVMALDRMTEEALDTIRQAAKEL